MRGQQDIAGFGATRTTGEALNTQLEGSSNGRRSSGVHGTSDVEGNSVTQPTIPDNESDGSARSAPPANQGFYQDVLLQCNTLIEG